MYNVYTMRLDTIHKTVNGKTYTVAKAGTHGADLLGPRGARLVLIQNIHNPEDWTLITDSLRPRSIPVVSIEAV